MTGLGADEPAAAPGGARRALATLATPAGGGADTGFADTGFAGYRRRPWQPGRPLPGFRVSPGHHTLRIRAGRYSSLEHSFGISDGDVIAFRCHGAMVWPRWLVSFVRPDLGISLKPE